LKIEGVGDPVGGPSPPSASGGLAVIAVGRNHAYVCGSGRKDKRCCPREAHRASFRAPGEISEQVLEATRPGPGLHRRSYRL